MGWNWPVTTPQRISTLPWLDFHFNAKWDCRSPKPQLRWSFLQICLRTVESSNQWLHIFSQFSLIVLIMPRPTHIGIRHEVLALAREGMRRSAIAGRVGLTHATVNNLILGTRQAHGGSSIDQTSSRPCFVEDGPTRSLHNCSGLEGVDEEFVRNEGWPENHQQPAFVPWLPCYRHTRKPLLTANHRRLRLEWEQRWQNLTVAQW